jgi:hypothetical protein
MTSIKRVASMDHVVFLLKRYMINTENRRLEEQQDTMDTVCEVVADTKNSCSIYYVWAVEHSESMVNHIERLIAIESIWGGQGAGAGGAVCGAYRTSYTMEMPPLVHPRRSRVDTARRRYADVQVVVNT